VGCSKAEERRKFSYTLAGRMLTVRVSHEASMNVGKFRSEVDTSYSNLLGDSVLNAIRNQSLLIRGGNFKELWSASRVLYDSLFAPALKFGKVKPESENRKGGRICISTNAPLRHLRWEAFIAPAEFSKRTKLNQWPYVVKQYKITYDSTSLFQKVKGASPFLERGPLTVSGKRMLERANIAVKQGLKPSEALRVMQLNALKASAEIRAHPREWTQIQVLE
jgi:hypothetical protein